MPKTAIRISPSDHGRRMSLSEFDLAEAQEGHLYELSRGVITVMDVPDRAHFAQVNAIRRQFSAYDLANPGRIHAIGTASDGKILLEDLESERHPDFLVYKSPPLDNEDLWSTWVPDLVIEVVSPSSRHRDYEEKPEEYLRFGIGEYWIVDRERQEMLVLRRVGGKW